MLWEPRSTARKLTDCGFFGVEMSTMIVPASSASRSRSRAHLEAAPSVPSVLSAV